MSYEEFLRGKPDAPKQTLYEAIDSLQDASAAFVSGVRGNDFRQADRATQLAFKSFDFIVGEIMRHRDTYRDRGIYQNSAFHREMDVATASMVSPATKAEHLAVPSAGPGNGRLPANRGAPIVISADNTEQNQTQRSYLHQFQDPK